MFVWKFVWVRVITQCWCVQAQIFYLLYPAARRGNQTYICITVRLSHCRSDVLQCQLNFSTINVATLPQNEWSAWPASHEVKCINHVHHCLPSNFQHWDSCLLLSLNNLLCCPQVSVWRALFGKEADKLEQANDDDKTYYIIEKEPLVNTYISVPRENSSLNCAAFNAGIVEAILTHSGFPAKVTVHWHKGTTLMIKFNDEVIARDKALEGR